MKLLSISALMRNLNLIRVNQRSFMTINETLEQLGFSRKEAMVYLALLELGQVPVSELIKKTHLHREIAYTSLQRLKEKDLVNFVRREGKRFYQAASPERILERSKENYQTIQKTLPELLELQKKAGKRQFVQVYEGFEGLKKVRELMLATVKEGDAIRILGASGKEYFKTMEDYYQSWNRRRDQKKIWYLIQCYQDQEKTLKENLDQKFKYAQTRALPENYQTPTSTAIFADNVVIQIWGEEPVMILIENPKVAANYRDIFESLWKLAK